VALVFCAVVAPGFGAACEVWAYADTEQTEKAKHKAMTKNDFIASSKLLKTGDQWEQCSATPQIKPLRYLNLG
jgi:hypothetical protein